jgi:hypothetical protein
MWINQNFLLQDDLNCEGSLNVGFVSLRGSGPLFFKMESGGQVRKDVAEDRDMLRICEMTHAHP